MNSRKVGHDNGSFQFSNESPRHSPAGEEPVIGLSRDGYGGAITAKVYTIKNMKATILPE